MSARATTAVLAAAWSAWALVSTVHAQAAAGEFERRLSAYRTLVDSFDATHGEQARHCALEGLWLLAQGGIARAGDPAPFARAAAAFRAAGRMKSADTFDLQVAKWEVRAGRTAAARERLLRIVEGKASTSGVGARWQLAQLARFAGAFGEAESWLAEAEKLLPEIDDRRNAKVLHFHIETQRTQLALARGLNAEGFRRLEALRASIPKGLGHEFALHRIDALVALGRARQARAEFERAASTYGATPDLLYRKLQFSLPLARVEADEALREQGFREALQDVESLRGQALGPGFELARMLFELEAREGLGDTSGVRRLAASIRSAPGASSAELSPQLAHVTALESAILFDDASAADRRRLRAALEHGFDRLVERWATMPPREAPYPYLHYRNRRFLVGELLHAIAALDEDEAGRAALEHVLRLHELGALARRMDSPLAVQDVLGSLEAGQGLLVYVFAWRRSFVITIDGEAVGLHEIPRGRNAVRRSAAAAVDAILATDGGDRARTCRALADHVLPKPVRERVAGWSHATVVASQDAGFLPLGELPLLDGEPVHRSVAISYVASLHGLGRRARPPVSADDAPSPDRPELFVLAAPEPAEEVVERFGHVAQRPRADDLVAAARALVGEDRVVSTTGDAATVDALRSEAARRARVLVLMAHGVVEREPVLVLAPSRLAPSGLVGGDTLRTALDSADGGSAELVILFSCGLARGAVRSGDDQAFRLGGVFLDAGARCVILAPGVLGRDVAARFGMRLLEVLRGERVSVAEGVRRVRVGLGDACGLLHVFGDGQHHPFPTGPL